MHWWLLEVWIGPQTSDEGKFERQQLDELLSTPIVTVTATTSEVGSRVMKPPSFWRGRPDGAISVANANAIAVAMGSGRRRR